MAESSTQADLGFLIPAAGGGERLGRGPKALLDLAGRPLVQWLAAKALAVAEEVVIAAPVDRIAEVQALCPGCRVVPGGATRQDSVVRLVAASTRPWLLIQDVARPFASPALLRAVAEAARETGAAGAFLHPEVPVARIQDGVVVAHFRPGEAGIFQAPQAFRRCLLMDVLAQAAAAGWQEQSTLQLVLRAGLPVRAVPGEKTNLKLTTADDLALGAGLAGWLV